MTRRKRGSNAVPEQTKRQQIVRIVVGQSNATKEDRRTKGRERYVAAETKFSLFITKIINLIIQIQCYICFI